jgi:phage terminase small subunit
MSRDRTPKKKPADPVEKVVPIRPDMTNATEPIKPIASRTGPNRPPEQTIAKLKEAAIKAGATPVKHTPRKRACDGLTIKQEAFSRAYVETGNATASYRRAYDAENMKEDTINKRAAELLCNGRITGRIQALRDELAKRTIVTLESLTDELEEAIEMARDTRQAAIMIQGIQAKAKLHGMITEKVEQRQSFVVEVPPQDATTEDWLAAVAPETRAG